MAGDKNEAATERSEIFIEILRSKSEPVLRRCGEPYLCDRKNHYAPDGSGELQPSETRREKTSRRHSATAPPP